MSRSSSSISLSSSSSSSSSSVNDDGISHYDPESLLQRLDSLTLSSLGASSAAVAATAEASMREEEGEALDTRRRKSLIMMKTMSLNQSCKDAIHQILADVSSQVTKDAAPEVKLREVLIHAKESGMTWERIFSFFSTNPDSTVAISKKDFAMGLQKLSSNAFPLSQVFACMHVCRRKGAYFLL